MNTHKLSTVPLSNIELIEQPVQEKNLDLESPALEVFTDFTRRMPLMLEQSTPVDVAIETMRKTHVKLKLVIDPRESFRGVITLADLVSVKVAMAAEATGLRREDLTVAHVMTGRDELHALDMEVLRTARIGDVLATMEAYGDQHILVVDQGRHSIRGIVSVTDVARALHVPVVINERAVSFAQIYRTLRA